MLDYMRMNLDRLRKDILTKILIKITQKMIIDYGKKKKNNKKLKIAKNKHDDRFMLEESD